MAEAELWGRRPGTVRDWLRSGRLEGYLFNRKEYRLPRAALERFRQQRGSTATRGDHRVTPEQAALVAKA